MKWHHSNLYIFQIMKDGKPTYAGKMLSLYREGSIKSTTHFCDKICKNTLVSFVKIKGFNGN